MQVSMSIKHFPLVRKIPQKATGIPQNSIWSWKCKSSSEGVVVAANIEHEDFSEVAKVDMETLPGEDASTDQVESELEGCINYGQLKNEIYILRN